MKLGTISFDITPFSGQHAYARTSGTAKRHSYPDASPPKEGGGAHWIENNLNSRFVLRFDLYILSSRARIV